MYQTVLLFCFRLVFGTGTSSGKSNWSHWGVAVTRAVEVRLGEIMSSQNNHVRLYDVIYYNLLGQIRLGWFRFEIIYEATLTEVFSFWFLCPCMLEG